MPLTMSLTREQMLREMDQALADEIERQSQTNHTHHTATDGKLVTDGNGPYIYAFTLDEPWDPQDDAPLKIANATGKEIKCFVVNARGTLITIASDKPFPEDILQHIDFIDDSTALLKRQREALKEAQEGEGKLASKSFGLVPYHITMISVEKQFSKQTTLRDSQCLAASKALGGEVTFIIGPPGTGKTLTLAAIAFTHLKEGRTVLIAAHTNIAINNAIMKLCELCKEAERDDLLAQGQVVRFGAVQKAELKDNKYQEVYLPRIAKRQNAQLQQEHDEYTRALSALKQRIGVLSQQQQVEIQGHQQMLEQCNTQYEQLRSNLQTLEEQERQRQTLLRVQQEQYRSELQQFERTWTETSRYLAQAKVLIIEQNDAYARTKQQEQGSLRRLLDARAMNGIQRFLHRVDIEKLERQVGEVTYQANQLLLSVQTAQNDEIRCQRIMNTLEPRIREYQEKIRQVDQQLNTPAAQAVDIARFQSELTQVQQRCRQEESLIGQVKQVHQSELQALSKQQLQLETQLAARDQQMRDIEKKIVENARVVGTTLTKTYMSQAVSSRHFDAVILDEVSMASMPLIYLAATHADRSVTFIGDPHQLAPIVNAETDSAKKWLKKDLFNFRGVLLEDASKEPNHSALLNVQSRMHPQIARIANTLVYQNKILDAFDESKLKHISPLPDAPLVLCDTQDAAPTSCATKKGSRTNYYHALCCLELAKKALQDLSEAKTATIPLIGIITPYRAQAKLIQYLIKEVKLHNIVQVGTAHSFQGLEFDVVIFDTVTASERRPSGFLSESDSIRMINVAITRAKHKLFIVAYYQHILQTFPKSSTLRLAVQHAAHSATYSSLDVVGTPLATALQKARTQRIPSEQLLKHVLMEEEILVLHPAKESEDEEISHYNENTFYDACKQDLSLARESITIVTPFLAPARVKELLPWLLEKQQQGVKITIYTKPLQECEAWHGKAAQMLLDVGLQLMYRPEMHQKAIILDEKTLYHGSLNVLSQHKSGESMLRLMKQPQIVKVLNEELQTAAITQQKIRTMTDDEMRKLKTISISINLLPALTSNCGCGSRFVPRPRKDGSGAFYGCENYRSCSHKNTVNITTDHLQQIPILQNRTCAQCGSSLKFLLQDRPQLILLCCKNQCEEKLRVVFTR